MEKQRGEDALQSSPLLFPRWSIPVCAARMHERSTSSSPPLPPSLREATFAGSSGGNVCTATTHEHTHTVRQTNTARPLIWNPGLDFAFSRRLPRTSPCAGVNIY